MSLLEGLDPAWREALRARVPANQREALAEFVTAQREAGEVYPPEHEVFAALALPPAAVRVVILGQDPYHGPSQAHGLAFSVRAGVAHPPSLRNIFKERESDLGLPPPQSGELSAWAREGVLLLNTVLTVRRGEAHAHKGRGWEQVTDAIFELVCAREAPVVFVLWGKPAQKKAKAIPRRHVVLEAPHPSPLSAYRGFFGSAPFSRVNAALEASGQPPVDWRVDEER